MYAFQEVHEHVPNRGSYSHWRVIHEDTFLWIRYITLGSLPEGTLPWVFTDWENLTDEERKNKFNSGKRLPMLKMKPIELQPTICTDSKCMGCDYPQPAWVKQDYITYSNPMPISLGTCTAATTPSIPTGWYQMVKEKEQGNNPMRYDTNTTSAVATIINAESETKGQREFLLAQLRDLTRYEWQDEKAAELRKLFNIDAPIAPKTSKELLAAFAAGTVVIDQKKVDAQAAFFAAEGGDRDDLWCENISDRYYGLTFSSLPVADWKGYEKAMTAYRALKKDTERSIVIGTPAEGLAALRAFEAWMPEQNAPTTATVQ